MELDFVTSDLLEEDCVEFEENYNEISDIDGERCGICMDLIIDRGVLDCCQHWFCFGCIDNWATITNLCPLCQSEFQFITCVPVYDTIGSGKTDDDSLSRDDEWYTDGKNNTQSFPSYYIDENAVICLDGNGCKIRSECISIEGDSNLDTSIACDSCDIWYHAFCVGFDPEGASEDTWLCPRCVANEIPELPEATKVERTINKCGPENGNGECSAEAAFSRKVSVSVADTGETALVVSMVGENHWTNEPSEIIFSTLQGQTNMDPDSPNVNLQPAHTDNTHPKLEVQELELSLSCHTSSSLQSKPMVLDELKNSTTDEAMDESSTSRNYSNLSEFLTQDQFSECDRKTGLDLGLSVGSLAYVNDANDDGAVEHVTGDVQHQNIAEESLIQANNIVSSVNEDAARVIGSKRKRDCSDEAHMKANDAHMSAHDDETKAKNENGAFPKKFRADGKAKMKLKEQEKASIPTSSLKCRPKKLKQLKGDASSDIMSIVKGTHHKLSKHHPHQNANDKSLKEGENTGLRVKKIIRSDAGNKDSYKDSSGVVQELRKEIREAVRNKSTGDIGENLFDPKLLAAFRAAVAGPKPDLPKKLSPMAVKTKKSLLQKGKVRENLTKKIYGDSNGKRKRAWDRDCEVEFWKYRCMRASKPEKIETLKSVLSLLRKNKESSDINPVSGCQASNPILSRLYLADTSIFPRKDDIKPLSALKVTSSSELKKELNLSEKSSDNHGTRIMETNNVLSKAGDDGTGTNKNIPSGKVVAANRLHSHTQAQAQAQRPSLSSSADTKVSSRNEMVMKSDDAKKDRKKWAMEVLARKKALACNSSKHEKQEDNAVLKGNYPLLAQLPVDMRPVLAPSRHNKIPISVRQTQLYRLTELFLKQTNLEVLRRTAVTELAVADAINIEKEVANRSNSKLVYLNLCSREISRHSEKSSSISATESNSLPLSGVLTDGIEDTTEECLTDPTILEALRNAGLLSDSPPNSPQHKEDVLDGLADSSTKTKEEEEPDNVFEMDPHYEVDIYGDFEYDIEGEEDYIGSSSVKVPKLQPEEGAQKLKVVFSTLIPETSSEDHQISDDHQILGNAEVLTDAPSLFTSHADVSHSTMENETDKAVPLESIRNEESEELSLAECEELYGPEKEPPINEHLGKLNGLDNSETATATEVLQSESSVQNENVGINQQDSSHEGKLSEKIQRKEKKLNTDTDKLSDGANSVSKKVEAYIKEHIRPLCKSGVITPEQYRWAVAKTTDKVMKYHSNSKNATFLIKEGEKVKKLAEQYLEASQQKEKSDPQ